MPEIREENFFKYWLQEFIDNVEEVDPRIQSRIIEAQTRLHQAPMEGVDSETRVFLDEARARPGALTVRALWTDMKDEEVLDVGKREERLLKFASTLCVGMLERGLHAAWAVRLERLANAVPDTHGLLISKVWDKFPRKYRDQLSANHTLWSDFCNAICNLEYGVQTIPEDLPLPWFNKPNAGGLLHDTPSQSRLVCRLNCYMPPTWRGADPDRRFTKDRPPIRDNAWTDPIPIPRHITLSTVEYGSALGQNAPAALANPGSSKVKTSRSKVVTPKKAHAQNSKLTGFGFTSTRQPKQQVDPLSTSVAGISSKLDSLGIKKIKKPVAQCTDRDIDHSLYLWPSYLFPALDDPTSADDFFSTLGLELVGLEHDPRDIVLDLKQCYLEIEPLLHSSPQIFTNEDWEGVARVSSKHRGFKVVIGLQFERHTLAWLSHDNNCHVYWFSRADIELVRPLRVPDVIRNYWLWCQYSVNWLRDKYESHELDQQSVSTVLSGAGNHPWRGVGRYSLDEITCRAGIPLWTLFGELLANPAKLAALMDTFYLFVLEQFSAVGETWSQSKKLNTYRGPDSFMLITTQAAVLRLHIFVPHHRTNNC
ncbi:hypothetical protein C8R47DRAFT_813889 [Mycena vitilis]|nr:hypothetical protein C8R47DRAFT_813889 [Mycena vitilis]